MNQGNSDYGIHCNSCNYEGPGKTNSGTSFLIFMVILCASVLFLPLIIVALAYMGWLIVKPAQRSCPNCNSKDYTPLTEEQAIALAHAQKTANTEEKNK